MKKKQTTRLAAAGLAAGAAALVASVPWIRKRHLRWGATDAEIATELTLDDRVPEPTYVTNRAITIQAPIEAVWPWLVQMGESPRAGFYSYAAIERLLGMRIENADRILPGLQALAVGDAIDRRGKLVVLAIEPHHLLVLGPPEGVGVAATWTLALFPTPHGATRLLSRCRSKIPPGAKGLLWLAILDPGHLLMERRMLREIKRLAEKAARPAAADMVRPPFSARAS